jgi:hypothetical protein
MQLSQGQDRQSLLPEGAPPAARARCVRAARRCRKEVPSYADCLLVSTPFVPSLGYPRKAGHFIASMTYRHGRLPLAGPGQLLDLG